MTVEFRRIVMIAMLIATAGGRARGDFTLPSFFVDDPTANSKDWAQAVNQGGGVINGDVNFSTMSTGTLNGNYYNTPAHPDGVTLSPQDSSMNQVVNGGGPGQTGQTSPVSPGEGLAPVANYLLSTSPGLGGPTSLTIKFSRPVMAVGLFTIDYFGPVQGTNTLTLAVYTPGGVLLGSADAVHYNFQTDHVYFMGYSAPGDVIGSAVFTRSADAEGDAIGIAAIEFATGGVPVGVPEPSAFALLVAGASALALRAWRRAPL